MCNPASISQAIEKAGGQYSSGTKLADNVTHLVVTEDHWKKGTKTPKGKYGFLLVVPSAAILLLRRNERHCGWDVLFLHDWIGRKGVQKFSTETIHI